MQTETENISINYNILDHSHESAKNTIVVNWLLGNLCNFSCSYCPEFLHAGTVEWPDIKVLQKFIQDMSNHFFGKQIYFEFTGGEVTLYPYLLELCDFIHDLNHTVGIISNGTRHYNWWSKQKNKFDHICFSYHAEHTKPNKFFNVVKTVAGEFRTHVNIMMNPDKWEDCITVAEKITHECTNVSLALQPLMQGLGAEETVFPYTPEQQEVLDRQHHLYGSKIKWTKKFNVPRGAMKMIDTVSNKSEISSAHRLISNNMNNWSGWECYAGLENLVIDWDGSILRGWCRVGSTIGNAYSSYILPDKPVLCNKKFCHCNLDIMSKKVKIKKL